MVYAGIGGLLNVAFDLLLIPKFGIEGSAFATLFSSIIADLYLWYIAWRVVGFDWNLKIWKIVWAAGLASIFIFILLKFEINIIIAGPATLVFYLAALYLFKENILDEIKSILLTGKKI